MKDFGFKRLFEDAKLPTRAHSTDAGLDLYSRESATVLPGEGKVFSTGVACNIPAGFYAKIDTRSSMAKKGWAVVGGVCDAFYTGELFVCLRNTSNSPLVVETGDRIAQIIFHYIATPDIVEVDSLFEGDRKDKSFGSSGA